MIKTENLVLGCLQRGRLLSDLSGNTAGTPQEAVQHISDIDASMMLMLHQPHMACMLAYRSDWMQVQG